MSRKNIMQTRSEIEAELDSIAPLLNNIGKQPVQSVPEGYFEQFSVRMPNEKATVIKMPLLRKWMTYAAAAVVTGLLVTSAFIFTDRKVSSFDFDHYSKIDISAEVVKLTDDELQNYLSTASGLVGADQVIRLEEIEISTEKHINQITDEDLLHYLNENEQIEKNVIKINTK